MVAILFVVGFLRPVTVVSGKANAAEPDITITFRGLMVFDQLSGHVQVVRLHSDADHHTVNIRVVGPGFPDGVDWGRNLPKGVSLQFEVLAEPALPPSASWGSLVPFNIKTLHPTSVTLGEFTRKRDGFGPVFTFNAGTFDGMEPENVDFISQLNPRVRNQRVPTLVEATILTLDTGQIGYLTGDGLDPFRLPKPEGATKWKITVSNEPDFNHVCGYHFRQYYKGFEYTRSGPVGYTAQYYAVPTTPTAGPCDGSHTQTMTLDEIVKGKQTPQAIETRPCIPISYY